MKDNETTLRDTPLREKLFHSEAEKHFFRRYQSLFSIQEVEENTVLQWAYGALLLAFFITFYGWIFSPAISLSTAAKGEHVCWPYFQSCERLFFLESVTDYSQSMFYAALYGLMLVAVYCIKKREWVLTHAILLLCWLWKFLVIFVLSKMTKANFDYYDIVLGAALLFLPHKLFFARLLFAFLYFLASTIKIHEGWILGTYFTTLQNGLPLFPDAIAPLVTSGVILLQIIGGWFLMSQKTLRQRAVLWIFVLFHLYSIILVGYRYPTTALTMLLVLFGPGYTPLRPPVDRKSVVGWAMVIALVAVQMIGYIIPGDQKLTLEGNAYGLFMFEANHQCRSTATFFLKDGTRVTDSRDNTSARYRCDPYDIWFRLKQKCRKRDDIKSIAWTFDHSINGGPFRRIVDVLDACSLEYHPFSRNTWIRDEHTAPVVGLPYKNTYDRP